MREKPKIIDDAIEKFINSVNELLGMRVKKIVLYGSYARGDFNKDSDIDIMILTDLTDEEIIRYRRSISDIAFDIEMDNNFDIEINPLLKNIDKFNYWVQALPFYMNVQKEGVVISMNTKIDNFLNTYNKW